MYVDLDLIKEEEESFITGNMSYDQQSEIWFTIISILKSIEKNQRKFHIDYMDSLIRNPLLKQYLNAKVESNTTTISLQALQDHVDQQLNILTECRSKLEEEERDILNADDVNDNAKDVPIKSKEYNFDGVPNLISEWQTHADSILKSIRPISSSDLLLKQQAMDLSKTIVSLNKSCKSVHEFITALKNIKNQTTEMLSDVKKK